MVEDKDFQELKYQVIQQGNDIKILKNLSADQETEIKVLRDQFKEVLNELRMFNFKVNLKKDGENIVQKQNDNIKASLQNNMKGLPINK